MGKFSVRSADSAEFFSSSYEKGSMIKLTSWLWTSTDYNHFHQKTFLLGRGGLIQPTKESIKVKKELGLSTERILVFSIREIVIETVFITEIYTAINYMQEEIVGSLTSALPP